MVILMTSLDNVKKSSRVIVLAATNSFTTIDSALLKSGRFDVKIRLDVPNMDDRLEILKIHTRNMNLAEDVDLEKV